MKVIGLIGAGLLALSSISHGDEYQGCRDAELMQLGHEIQDVFGAAYCLGVVQGARDMATLHKVETGVRSVCVPKEKTTIELVMEFNQVSYQSREYPLSGSVSGFLMINYPCK